MARSEKDVENSVNNGGGRLTANSNVQLTEEAKK